MGEGWLIYNRMCGGTGDGYHVIVFAFLLVVVVVVVVVLFFFFFHILSPFIWVIRA